MNQAAELFEPFGASQTRALGQFVPVDCGPRIENLVAELAHHRVIGFPARQQYLMPQLVGLDQVATQIGERVSDESFSRLREPPVRPTEEHSRCVAACTVLAISMAMVKGPTPPGTGV